jgi:hypothetical protein
VSIIPVITFLNDMLSFVKGPYHRHVGRHTQRFCQRAVQRTTDECQKRVLMVSAIAADELVAAILGVSDRNPSGPFQPRVYKKITKMQVTKALRMYTSALLVLLGKHKELLLQKTKFTEQELLQVWCWVFDYSPSDMQLFDQIFLPAYAQKGIDGLAEIVGRNIIDTFYSSASLNALEIEALRDILIDDVTAIIANLNRMG